MFEKNIQIVSMEVVIKRDIKEEKQGEILARFLKHHFSKVTFLNLTIKLTILST